MKKFAIRHQVGIKATPEAVYQALTDTKKLAAWWTSDTRGEGARVGAVLQFWFGDFCQKFEVTELKPNQSVAWKGAMDGLEEWAGTEVRFTLKQDEKQTWVDFAHGGWESDGDFFSHCSTKWAVFMLSLKDLLEKGKGQPAPNDVSINHD